MEPKQPRLRLHINPTAEWKLRSGHPWLYDQSIHQQNRSGELGELAVLYDRHDNFLAIGLFDPDSPLRVRILHKGKPQTIDESWWRAHFREAIERRRDLFDAQTTGYRGIYGESDGWPGLVLDRYDTTLVLKLYTAAWFPHLELITSIILSELKPERLVLRLSRNIQATARQFPRPIRWGEGQGEGLSDGQILYGPPVEGPVIFLETGLRFEADVLRGQKTGFFLDQRENRRMVESLARDREVLNAFSFSGGFSLYAARGGAKSVADIDISAHALESAKRNFALNQTTCPHELIQADAFEWLEHNKTRRFDLVILDPPSLAKREAERDRALAAYAKLAQSGISALRPGGILMAGSCSAHVSATDFFRTIRQVAIKSNRPFEETQTTNHPPDHPATFPEAQYLKCIYLQF